MRDDVNGVTSFLQRPLLKQLRRLTGQTNDYFTDWQCLQYITCSIMDIDIMHYLQYVENALYGC